MHLKRLEAVPQECRGGLGRVSPAVILGMKDPAELVDAEGVPGMKSYMPNQAIFRPEVDGIGPRSSAMLSAMNCLVCSSVITPSGTWVMTPGSLV